ncbi:MAG: proteasome accessory factor PafA2 family protein [Tepidisphaeraceae bacterium]
MPATHLMGFEQEMALCTTSRGAGPDLETLLNKLNAIAEESLVHLRGLGEGGIFLVNGGRLYVDCQKYEYASPECTAPDEIVKYLLAGERILAALASELARRTGADDAALYRCNVDYTGASTWGAHESYLTRSEPSKLAADLIPFLVARVVTAGAGGFRPLTQTGCSFTLSPRAWHICLPASESSTGDHARGIFHIKDQTLSSKGYHRLHVLVGDALCSQVQNWLKFASTSLVVAMADAGLHPGRDVTLCAPVEALRDFASDPTCKVKARTNSGHAMSAGDIQRHYLELARLHVHAHWMPSWAPEAVEKWDDMLHRLDGAPDSVATCLDWGIKHRVFQSHIEKSGFNPRLLRHWTHLTDLLRRCIDSVPGVPTKPDQFADFVLDRRGPLGKIVAHLAPHLPSRDMNWDQLQPYLKLRSELFALDFKFGRLGDKGIFNCLDRTGVLDHRLAGIDDAQIEFAAANPPPLGRAKLRGEAIRRLHKKAKSDASNWMTVYDSSRGMVLNLSNPFAAEEVWSKKTKQNPGEDFPF